MQNLTRFKRSFKAISPIIAVLLMIAIAVVASLVAYAWIMGYLSSGTSKSGNAIQIQSYTTGGNLVVYVQNTGQGTVHLKQDGSVYVNNVLEGILRANGQDVATGALVPIGAGQTVALVINCPFNPGDKIKIVTVEGTSAQVAGTSSGSATSSGSNGSGSSGTQPTSVTVVLAAGTGGTVNPSGSQTIATGTILGIAATANSGYQFSSWTFTGSIQINSPTSASTTAQINGAGTITANFVSTTTPRLILTVGAGQNVLVNAVSSVITVQCQDGSGNPVTTGGINVALSTTSSSGAFYSDAGGTTQVTSIATGSGSSTVSFYYKDSSVVSATLTASASGYSPVSTTLTVASPTPTPTPPPTSSPTPSSGPTATPTPSSNPNPLLDQFAITVPTSATAGSSFSVTVTAQDESQNTVTTYTGTIHFTSSDSQAILPSDSTLNSGTKTFTVTLKTAGSETITASDGTVTNISPLITVNAAAASKLVYTAGISQSITTSDVSSVITVQRQDSVSNPTTTGAITVNLASSSSNGRFYSDSGGSNRITSISIAAGSSSASFYYYDSSSGTPTLTASSSGLTSATTQFTINGNQLAFTAGKTQNLPTNQGICSHHRSKPEYKWQFT